MLMRNKNFLEGVIVFSVMTGLLLPVRLFFVTYISTEWFGSFGIISAISVLMIILTKKGKLGKFGKMFEHQMNKLQKGKRAKIIYGQSIFFLLILGGTIFAIEQGNSVHIDLKNQLLEEHKEFTNPEEILKKTNELHFEDWVYGLVGMFLAIFFAFPQLSAVLAVLNDSLNGWILHFYTVAFVEYLELFGILIFFKFSFSKNSLLPLDDKKTQREIV
jgi:hypothetical protein